MLITSYGINIGGSENKKRWPIGIIKHAHFIGGKPPRRGENMSSNKSSPRLHHRQKSYRGKKNILKTRLFGVFSPPSTEEIQSKFINFAGRWRWVAALERASVALLASPPRLDSLSSQSSLTGCDAAHRSSAPGFYPTFPVNIQNIRRRNSLKKKKEEEDCK